MKKGKEKKQNPQNPFPQYCDYFCKHASFTGPESSGACRREISVWCKYFNRYNNKNNKCLAE